MRASNGSRLRMVTLSVGLMVGGSLLSGCHKREAEQPAAPPPAAPAAAKEPPEPPLPPAPSDPASVKKAMADLKKQFADMQQSFTDLSKDLEAIPPDLPGYPQLRGHFYQTEEARGVTDARVTMLSDRVQAAISSNRPEELQSVANDIAKTSRDGRKLGEMYIKLLHQVMAYQRASDHRKEAVAAQAAKAPKSAKPAKSKD